MQYRQGKIYKICASVRAAFDLKMRYPISNMYKVIGELFGILLLFHTNSNYRFHIRIPLVSMDEIWSTGNRAFLGYFNINKV